MKFNADRALQPWLLFGGGYGDFAPAESRDGLVNVRASGNSGTLEFGGGVDTKSFTGGGTVKVKDELKIDFSIKTK